MADLVLRIDDRDFSGWTSMQVQRELDSLADSFDLELVADSASALAQITEDSACQILLDGETVLSGYVDEVGRSYDASSRKLTISGRSRAGDLVDCSAVHLSWSKTPILQIARDICDPFGIDVDNLLFEELPTEPFFKIEQGETCFAALDRLARSHGTRIVSWPDGSLRFTRTGTLRYPDVIIEAGLNVESGGVVERSNERFSRYIFRAQLAASDDNFGASASPKYEVTDDGVSRHRPLVVDVDGQRGVKALEEAAAWERNTRAGRARMLTYSVVDPIDPRSSWRHKHGIWEPNIIVTVRDGELDIEGEFLVTSVTLSRDDSGTRTQLQLVHAQAYDIKKPPKKKGKKGFSW